ncbi:MAG: hypothetical protein UY28_C0004G0052 [Candidatus Amesbacteria bacterium GW2011_GWB1_48_13]|uniref:Uncharacterized protein n=1 Tax=Candidatus Amesbacteria bacterium GW2011_GWB1_48_13 TaxID=1618362 RepID=A0A0G1UVL9_9BACT|nr:MAG: hypothetical protein UY28_C0004G0052 [Candidatus Amesbacteria bacterium GW2011_GWB1_48_13]
MNGQATILDARGQAIGQEPEQQQGIAQDSNVPKMIGLHVAQQIAKAVAAEMEDYVKRNAVPSGELHVNIVSFKKKNKLRVTLCRQKNNIRIIGTPLREIDIEWDLKP